ncbi:MAG: ferrous iron transport protein A [Halanaerobium sp.]|nr:ferrous iron transport protein A [Halanaerobium sp.]
MTLAEIRPGNDVLIEEIPDRMVRAQAIRFGISEGSVVSCFVRIPSGPIILRKNFQEIALGQKLAQKIKVKFVR